MRRLLRRLHAWLIKPSHDPTPYVALTVAIMLTRMSGGYLDNRHTPGL